MNKISEKILDKIKQQHIIPKPKWQFLLKDYLIWVVFIIATIIGSLSIGVIIHLLVDFDWTAYQYLDKGFFEYFVISLPYLWLVLLIIFVILAYYQFRHTKKGYKYRPYTIVLLSVSVSFILGLSLFAIGTARRADHLLSEAVPSYERMIKRKSHVWMNPENGMLAGKIIFVTNQQSFLLEDLNNKKWTIYNTDALKHEVIIIEIDEMIRIVGEQRGDNIFNADRIMPWQRMQGKSGMRKFR